MTTRQVFSFSKGEVVLIEDIEDINGLLIDGEHIELIPGTAGEEYRFLKAMKITVIITTK